MNPNILATATLRRVVDARLGTKDEAWEVVIELNAGAGAEAVSGLKTGVLLAVHELMGQGGKVRRLKTLVERR